MTPEHIKDLNNQISYALTNAETILKEYDFLWRVLKQAVLTHGGGLRIDPAMAEAAKADTRLLEFGGSGVRLISP